MDEQVIVGTSEGLEFRLRWSEVQSPANAADATRGHLLALGAGRKIWGDITASDEAGIEWTWVELLEHLAGSWHRLSFEEADPLGLNADPDNLRASAQQRWAGIPEVVRSQQEEDLWAFEHAHNLASGIQGLWVPPLWILREGLGFRLAGKELSVALPEAASLKTLSDLGDAICARVAGLQDARSRQVLTAWRRREEIGISEFLAIATSLPEEEIREIADGQSLDENWELSSGLRANELIAAARMIGPGLTVAKKRSILRRIRSIPRIETPELDSLGKEVCKEVPLSKAPYDQGEFLARSVRKRLNNPDAGIDPERILKSFGVRINNLATDAREFEAFCCWGSQHGPAVFVNPLGRHSQELRGRRATLAHEICHLIIDRGGGLPLAEVLGGRVSRAIESRAGAFAAEFLMPKQIATREFSNSTNPKRTLHSLCTRYQASREIVAWQALNPGLPPAAKNHLRKCVTHPERYN